MTSETSRDLPTPGLPMTVTTSQRDPSMERVTASTMAPRSSRRPIIGGRPMGSSSIDGRLGDSSDIRAPVGVCCRTVCADSPMVVHEIWQNGRIRDVRGPVETRFNFLAAGY
jgi:hypothetical protein